MTRGRPPRAEPPTSGLHREFGPALPEAYGTAFVVAWVRDPECVFATWEGGETLRAKDLTDGSVREVRVRHAGCWYFGARPEHEYQMELLAAGRVVAVSRRVRTPRRGPATQVDEARVPTAGQQDVLRELAGRLEFLLRRGGDGEGRISS